MIRCSGLRRSQALLDLPCQLVRHSGLYQSTGTPFCQFGDAADAAGDDACSAGSRFQQYIGNSFRVTGQDHRVGSAYQSGSSFCGLAPCQDDEVSDSQSLGLPFQFSPQWSIADNVASEANAILR